MFTIAKAALAAALATAVGAMPAQAETVERTTFVRYGDLDLRRSADVTTLERRVRRAAIAVCAGNGTRDMTMLAAEGRCRKIALSNAMPRVELAVAGARGGKALARAATGMSFAAN
jgi:UrcA family protein